MEWLVFPLCFLKLPRVPHLQEYFRDPWLLCHSSNTSNQVQVGVEAWLLQGWVRKLSEQDVFGVVPEQGCSPRRAADCVFRHWIAWSWGTASDQTNYVSAFPCCILWCIYTKSSWRIITEVAQNLPFVLPEQMTADFSLLWSTPAPISVGSINRWLPQAPGLALMRAVV